MTLPILDHRHHVPGGAAGFQDRSRQLTIGQLDIAIDVVGTPAAAVLEHTMDALGVIVHVDPSRGRSRHRHTVEPVGPRGGS